MNIISQPKNRSIYAVLGIALLFFGTETAYADSPSNTSHLNIQALGWSKSFITPTTDSDDPSANIDISFSYPKITNANSADEKAFNVEIKSTAEEIWYTQQNPPQTDALLSNSSVNLSFSVNADENCPKELICVSFNYTSEQPVLFSYSWIKGHGRFMSLDDYFNTSKPGWFTEYKTIVLEALNKQTPQNNVGNGKDDLTDINVEKNASIIEFDSDILNPTNFEPDKKGLCINIDRYTANSSQDAPDIIFIPWSDLRPVLNAQGPLKNLFNHSFLKP